MKKILFLLLCIILVVALAGCGNNTTAVGDKKDEAGDTSAQHAFSVSETCQVYFAPGNLEYCPASKTWKFADEAYVTMGMDNELASKDYDGWLDLFCWGANGLSGIEPYSTVYDNLLYGDGHNNIAGTDYDFSKAANKQLGGEWRMFTHDEIHYLFMFRENAEELFGYGMI